MKKLMSCRGGGDISDDDVVEVVESALRNCRSAAAVVAVLFL